MPLSTGSYYDFQPSATFGRALLTTAYSCFPWSQAPKGSYIPQNLLAPSARVPREHREWPNHGCGRRHRACDL